METHIRSSNELRRNYIKIVELCRSGKTPVFLTSKSAGIMVIMDIDTYNRKEEMLAAAERLMNGE